jgi:DNA-binding GntR family transcriptional regulator
MTSSPPAADRATTAPLTRLEADLDARPVERRALRDGVYDTILELLLEGDVRPGQSLSIDGLARQLGVSPTPVREAMVQLEHTGLVTRAALKGYRVAPPLTAERMAELVDARSLLELAAVRGAIPLTPEGILHLKAAHADHVVAAAEVKESQARDDRAAWRALRHYYDADWAFHRTLLEHCHNTYLLQLAESLSPQVHRMRQSAGHGVTDVDLAVAEHGAILRAATTGLTADTEVAMRRHLEGVRDRSLAESEPGS